jgi:PEP-CTERM motif
LPAGKPIDDCPPSVPNVKGRHLHESGSWAHFSAGWQSKARKNQRDGFQRSCFREDLLIPRIMKILFRHSHHGSAFRPYLGEFVMCKRLLLCMAMLAFQVGSSGQVQAGQIITYDLTWSGAAFDNLAVATGQITLDVNLINNPGTTSQNSSAFVQAFSITVSNASLDNGIYGFADFDGASTSGGFILDTGGGTLDFTKQLFGQSTPGGPWGSTQDGLTGNFNIFTNGTSSQAPTGVGDFEIKVGNGDNADLLYLTGFKPETSVSPVPEPATLTMLCIGMAGLAAYRVRRRPRYTSTERSAV